MAPERILSKPYNSSAEVWSLGLSVVELAIGRFPYPADADVPPGSLSCIDLMQCVVNERPPHLPEAPERFSADFVNFIECACDPAVERRPTPEQALGHPFVVLNTRKWTDHTPATVQWVQAVMHQRELKRRAGTEVGLVASPLKTSPVPGSLEAMFQ